MRTVRIFSNTVTSEQFTLDRGGLLRHLLHSFFAFGSSGNGGTALSGIKLSRAGDLDTVGIFNDGSLSELLIAYGNTTSHAGGMAQVWLDFIDIPIPDKAVLSVFHDSVSGVISGYRSSFILFLE